MEIEAVGLQLVETAETEAAGLPLVEDIMGHKEELVKDVGLQEIMLEAFQAQGGIAAEIIDVTIGLDIDQIGIGKTMFIEGIHIGLILLIETIS